MRHGPNQSVQSVRAVAGTRAIEVAREATQLIFEHRERANVMDLALLIEAAHRFGADDFAAAGVDGGERDMRIDGAQRSLHHFATVIHLGDDSVRIVLPVRLDSLLRPRTRLVTTA